MEASLILLLICCCTYVELCAALITTSPAPRTAPSEARSTCLRSTGATCAPRRYLHRSRQLILHVWQWPTLLWCCFFSFPVRAPIFSALLWTSQWFFAPYLLYETEISRLKKQKSLQGQRMHAKWRTEIAKEKAALAMHSRNIQVFLDAKVLRGVRARHTWGKKCFLHMQDRDHGVRRYHRVGLLLPYKFAVESHWPLAASLRLLLQWLLAMANFCLFAYVIISLI